MKAVAVAIGEQRAARVEEGEVGNLRRARWRRRPHGFQRGGFVRGGRCVVFADFCVSGTLAPRASVYFDTRCGSSGCVCSSETRPSAANAPGWRQNARQDRDAESQNTSHGFACQL
jgi:hypothetical protein